MNLQTFIQRLDNVKKNGSAVSARCPAHDDKTNSLSVTQGKDGRILLHCFAGCRSEDIVSAMGLSMSDLYPEQKERSHREAEYIYTPTLKKVKYRKADGDKYCAWYHLDGSSWVNGRQGNQVPLYTGSVELCSSVFLVEGEKDVNSINKYGWPAVSLPDGANSKWQDEYSTVLQGRDIVIIPDHDKAGMKYADFCAANLKDVARTVRLLDLKTIWPEIPLHGDVSDYLQAVGDDGFATIMRSIPQEEYTPSPTDPFLSCFKPLEGFAEQEAAWIVPGWIPEGQITLICADGGIGKTTLWINLLSALSSGTGSIFDSEGITRPPARVAFLTSEDSVTKKLRRKIREAGADLNNIITVDVSADKTGELRDFKFGSPKMAEFIRAYKPKICVFDPLQAYVPADVNMGSRNAMRDCLAPLVSLGEEVGTGFLIINHSNKRKGAWGRDRVSDSADIWDIARSVIMCGVADDDDVRYISQEKNNYARRQETILFSITDQEQLERVGTTWKHDRDFVLDNSVTTSKPKTTECAEWITNYLFDHGGECLTADLDDAAKQAGHKAHTLRRAKEQLKADNTIYYRNAGVGATKIWHTVLKGTPVFNDLDE